MGARGQGLGGKLFAKPRKDKLLSDQPEACVTGTAGFWPLLGWEVEEVVYEERWGKGRKEPVGRATGC